MKQISFKIIGDHSGMTKSVKEIERMFKGLKGLGKNIEVKVDNRNLIAAESRFKKLADSAMMVNDGVVRANGNLVRMIRLLTEADRLARSAGGAIGGVGRGGTSGGRVNGGSRTGSVDPTSARSQLSAFSGFIRGGQSFTSQVGALASGVGRLGASAALPLVAIAQLTREMYNAYKITLEWGQANADLAAALATSRDATATLTAEQIDLGRYVKDGIVGVAQLQTELSKLGFNKGEIRQMGDDLARFAVVADAKASDAAEAVGAAIQSFNLDATEAGRVTSVMGVAIGKTALDFEKLKVGIGTTFATAKTFGFEIEDVTTLLGDLSNKGLSASVAATATRNILLNLADANGELAKTIGKPVTNMEELVAALVDLRERGIDLAQTFELTDKRSVNAFNAFLRGAEGLLELKEAISGASGEFEVMEKERLNSLQGSLTLNKNAVDALYAALSQDFGTEGFLSDAINFTTDLINKMTDLIRLRPAEAILKEGSGVISALQALQDTNDPGVRAKLIDELNVKYSNYIGNLDLETASQEQLAEKLREVRGEISRKYDFEDKSDKFKDAVKRENELLDEQIDLLTTKNNLKDFSPLYSLGIEGDIKKVNDELRTQRALQLELIRGNLNKTGDLSVPQFEKLTKGASGRGTQNAVARGLLGQFNARFSKFDTLPTVGSDGKAFAKGDTAGQIKRQLELIEAERDLVDENGAAYAELTKRLKGYEEQLDKVYKSRDLKIKGGKGDKRNKDEEALVAGSIRYLERELKKADEALAKSGVVNDAGLVAAVENARKQLEEAKKKQKEAFKKTDEELLELEKIGIDERRRAREKEAKSLISDEKTLKIQLERVRLDADLEAAEAEKRFYEKRGEVATKEYSGVIDRISQINDQIVENIKDMGTQVREVFRDLSIEKYAAYAKDRIKNEEDLQLALDAIFLSAEINRLEERLKFEKLAGEELIKIQQEIEDKKKKAAAAKAGSEFGINSVLGGISDGAFGAIVSAGQGILKGGASEKDFKKFDRERERILLEEKRRSNLAQQEVAIKAGDYETLKQLQKEYFDIEIKNQELIKEGDEEIKDGRLKIWEEIKKAAELVGGVVNKLYEVQNAKLERQLEQELANIDTLYNARLSNENLTQAERERLEAEYEKKKEVANKKAAEERKKIALKQARIEMALNIIEAAPNLFQIGVALATGLAQLAIIGNTKFNKGGFTDKYGYGRADSSGQVPVGVVHPNEYVSPTQQVRRMPDVFNALDRDRSQRGYAESYLRAKYSSIDPAMLYEVVSLAVESGSERGTMAGSHHGARRAAKEFDSRFQTQLISR